MAEPSLVETFAGPAAFDDIDQYFLLLLAPRLFYMSPELRPSNTSHRQKKPSFTIK